MIANQRKHGRLDGEGVECSHGLVENISAGGIVLRGTLPEDERVEIVLGEGDDQINVTVERIWSSPIGRHASRTGYRFVDTPPNFIEALKGVRLPVRQPRVV